MKRIVKVSCTFLLLYLLIGIGIVKTNAATIGIGESNTGVIDICDEREFVFKIKKPMKVKITLTLGENQDTELWDEELDDDCLLMSLLNEDTVDELFEKEIRAGSIYSRTVSLKKGKYSISFFNGDAKMSYSLTIKDVSEYAKKIKINKKKAEIYTKQTLKLKVSPKRKGYFLQKVQWKSSNKKVAIVDKNGKVTGKKPGKCTISAKVKGGKKVKCKVTVKKRPDIVIKDVDLYINSVGGIEVSIKVENNTKKTIKYVYATVKFYNAVGDAAYCEITGRNYRNLQMIGPIKSGKTGTYDFGPIGYNEIVNKIGFKTVKVQFMDGSVKTYTVNKSAKYYIY